MNRKILAIILLLLFTPFIFFSPAYGEEWVQTKLDGTWKSISLNHVEAEGENWGVAIWQIKVTNFKGLTVNIFAPWFDTWRRWYEVNNWFAFSVRIAISNGTTNYGAALRIFGKEEVSVPLPWVFETVQIRAASQRDLSNPNDPYEVDDLADKKGWNSFATNYGESMAHEYQAYIGISSFGQVQVCYFDPQDKKWFGDTLAVEGYNYWGQNVTVTLSYWHGGYGSITADLGINLEGSTLPSYEPAVQKAFMDYIWDAIFAFIKGIGDWFVWLAMLLTALFTAMGPFLPLLPIIFMFWILGVTVEAIETGRIELLAEALYAVYETIKKVIQVIVNIALTVWSIIKFW